MSKIKVGIIGVGGIAKLHVPGWHMSEHAELIAGSDINNSILEDWGNINQIKKLYLDPLDMINDPDIDVIDICAPNNYHCDLAIKAMQAGKDVLCEKPLAPNASQIKKMIEVRDQTKKKLMCAQHFRFRKDSQLIKDQSTSIGSIYHARSWMLRRNYLPVSLGFLKKENSGGGPCIDIGVHVLDLTLWFMNNPEPLSVTGVSKTELAKQPNSFSYNGEYDKEAMNVEDFAAAFVRFKNGATLMLEVSWMLHHKLPEDKIEDMQVWLYGREAGLHWPNCEIIKNDINSQTHITKKIEGNLKDTIEPHAKECIEFAEFVANDQPVAIPAEHSLQVMKILDGIYKSQELGKEIILE